MKFTLTATILTLIGYLARIQVEADLFSKMPGGRANSRFVKNKSAPKLCSACSGGKGKGGKGRGGRGKGKGSSCSQPDTIECGGEVRMMYRELVYFALTSIEPKGLRLRYYNSSKAQLPSLRA